MPDYISRGYDVVKENHIVCGDNQIHNLHIKKKEKIT